MTYKNYWHLTVLTKLKEYRRLQTHATVTQLRLVDFFFFDIIDLFA